MTSETGLLPSFPSQFALNQRISYHSDSKPFKLFFGRPLSYLDNYFNSISKLKTLCEITSLTKVMLQIIYPSIYKKVTKYSANVEKACVLQDIIGNILLDKVPPSALKPAGLDTPFEDKHFKVEKVLDHDSPPSNCYYLVKSKGYPDSDNSWVAAKAFGSQQPISTYWRKKYPKKKCHK
ncbi:Chromo domain-containing protein [Balamuthia mandrillaris]